MAHSRLAMVKISLSPSKVETFRKFYEEEMNGIVTEESVVQSIMGTTEWKPAMIFGSAFHKILEVDAKAFYDPVKKLYFVQDDQMPEAVVMVQSEVDVANRYREAYPNMVHEIKAKHRTQINEYDVTINMRIDGMCGVTVHEKKTAARFFGIEGFERSMQWRFYAMATECRIVQYDVFIVTEPKTGPRNIEHKPFQFIPYREMKADTDRWILQLIRFAEDRGLMDYLIPNWNNEAIF